MKRILLFIIICTYYTASAQTNFIADINPGNDGSDPKGKTAFDQKAYFAADDGVHGNEVWVTDGTEAGTTLFMDVFPGSDSGISFNFKAIAALNQLFFIAKDNIQNHALYKTDGTLANTIKLKTFGGAEPSFADEINGQLIFSAENRLWKTDGTIAGTTQISNGAIFGDRFIKSGNEIYFSGSTPNGLGNELYKTDGTTAGTSIIKDIRTNGNSFPNFFNVINGIVYFIADDFTNGTELWKTDGTDAGTTLVSDLTPGNGGSFSTNSILLTYNSELFFITNNSLWKSDGSAAGTVEIYNNMGNIRNADVVNNMMLFFPFSSSSIENEPIWVSDGTSAGTTSIVTGYAEFSHNGAKKVVGNELYFQGYTFREGYELWKTDGTAAGTVLVKDINAFGDDNNVEDIIDFYGSALFTVSDGNWLKDELYISDGSEAGTFLVKDINQQGNNSSNSNNFFEFNGEVFFTADNGENGSELFTFSNGNPTLLKDINPGVFPSNPSNLTIFNNTLYFTATSKLEGRELWKTDGTPGGTSIVTDINPGNADGVDTDAIVIMNNKMYFFADNGNDGLELWESDGSAAGTNMVIDLNGIPEASTNQPELVVLNNLIYFPGDDGTTGLELYSTDGTPAGTSLVRDVNTSGDSAIKNLVVHPHTNKLYFSANDGNETRLWQTDGTNTFAQLVGRTQQFELSGTRDVGTSNNPDIQTGTEMYFRGISQRTFNNGDELWAIDYNGSVSEVLNINTDNRAGSFPSKLTNVDGRLFFTAYETTHGEELWTTDNTSSAQLVKDIDPGSSGSSIVDIGSLGGFAFLSAGEGNGDIELWISDGTDTGTYIFEEINPATATSNPGSRPMNFTTINDTMYFSADNGTTGQELYTLNQAALSNEDEQFGQINDVVLYPNPAENILQIDSNGTKIESYGIYDVLGQLVQQADVSDNLDSVTIDVSSLDSGIYIVNVVTGETSISKKFIKN
ncbi:MAG: T9SS type A sorting domain-containing protein [Nonlabens sp.]